MRSTQILFLPCILFVCFVIPLLSPVETQATSNTSNTLDAEEIFQRGKEFYLEHKFDQAKILFQQCVNQEPKNAEYLCWLAQSMSYALAEQAKQGASKLTMMPEGKMIRNLFTKAVEIAPSNERARLGYAILLRDIPGWLGGDLEEAEKILKELLKENPHNIFAYHHLGNLYIRKEENFKKGIQYLMDGIKEAESRTLASEEQMFLDNMYHAVGKAYLESLEKSEEALPYLEKSFAINSTSVVTMIDLIQAYRNLGRKEKAGEILHKAAEIVKDRKYKRFKKDIELAAKRLDMEKEINL